MCTCAQEPALAPYPRQALLCRERLSPPAAAREGLSLAGSCVDTRRRRRPSAPREFHCPATRVPAQAASEPLVGDQHRDDDRDTRETGPHAERKSLVSGEAAPRPQRTFDDIVHDDRQAERPEQDQPLVPDGQRPARAPAAGS